MLLLGLPSALWVIAVLAAACLLDRVLGEPRRWHPLVGFGRLADSLAARLNTRDARPGAGRRRGLWALFLALVPFTALGFWLQSVLWTSGGWGRLFWALLAIVVLYWSLGWRSLVMHLGAIQAAFAGEDIDRARDAVGRIVSRDCRSADWPALRRAAIESGLENASDAVVGPLFWFALLGIPGALLYRLSNTLDALWGYRSPRWRYFGWAAARWDDALNLVPARLTALTFALAAGSGRATVRALKAWRTQARVCASPNGGPVMCAGAGALNVRLGGPARYHGELKDKPWFGGTREPGPADLVRAIRLINRSLALVLSIIMAALLLAWRLG